MPDHAPRLLVTGAGGQLGQLVIDQLLNLVPAAQIVATVRNPDAGQRLAAHGVEVRIADYTRLETLDAALAGIGRVLLISSNVLGQRTAQHRAVIEAVGRAAVGLLAYTSVLHADTSPLGLAGEHRETGNRGITPGSSGFFGLSNAGEYDSLVACRRPPVCPICHVPSWKLCWWNCWASWPI